jgi:hypothetical protein
MLSTKRVRGCNGACRLIVALVDVPVEICNWEEG